MKADWTYGYHALGALLERDPARIRKLFVVKDRDDERTRDLIHKARIAGVSVERISRFKLDERISAPHQGVAAEVLPSPVKNESDLERDFSELTDTPFLLVLDGVTDPHNLGACLRGADAAGAQGVIAPKDRSASLNATVSKVACGAAETLPYYQVTNLSRTLKWLQEQGVWVVGTAGEATESIYESQLNGPVAIVVGAEGKGMRRLTRESCDLLVNIPMAGSVSSLNVSVATGVVLFEVVRQRRTH